MAKIDISFIIIEYYSLEEILLCIDSIHNIVNDLEYEIIVSSNSGYDSSKQEELRLNHKDVIWCFNEFNNGFAYGMNSGIKQASGEFIVLQNPDTRYESGRLSSALQLLKNDPTIGIIGPKIVNRNGEIQDSCRSFLTPGEVVSRFVQRKIHKKGAILDKKFDYETKQKVNWIIGACMITSRKAITKVGPLNERFFMYVEDMEWCLRFWENKLAVVYFPDLVISYEGDRKSTLGKKFLYPFSFNKYTYYHVKNYLIFLRHHGTKINRLKKSVEAKS